MKIQNFIFCWNEYVNNAFLLKRMLAPFGETTVINSNVNFHYGQWININDGYFAEQWNTLLANIDDDTDYIFHIQADAVCDDERFRILFDRFKEAVEQHKIGIYAPDVDYTPCIYDRKSLNRILLVSKYNWKYLYEVPCTDCTAWFINTKFMDKKPLFDLSVNSIGWGADFYYAAKSLLAGYKVVRDYQVRIDHPKKTTYNQMEGSRQFLKWLFMQDTEIFFKMGFLHTEYMIIRMNE